MVESNSRYRKSKSDYEEWRLYDKEPDFCEKIRVSVNKRVDMSCHTGIERRLARETHQLLYHGTSRTAAEAILANGIDLSKGRSGRHYSSGPAFYLFFNFQSALYWAKHEFANDFAIIVFSVPKVLLDTRKHNGLSLNPEYRSKNMKLWEKIVWYCMSKYKRYSCIGSTLKQYNFIIAPTCNNIRGFMENHEKPRFFKDKQQLCIRKSGYARKINAYISEVMFNGL